MRVIKLTRKQLQIKAVASSVAGSYKYKLRASYRNVNDGVARAVVEEEATSEVRVGARPGDKDLASSSLAASCPPAWPRDGM
jgi:hypothetical protein